MNFVGEDCKAAIAVKNKAVVTVKDKSGRKLSGYTTWVSDDIRNVIETFPVVFNISAGEEMTIVIGLDKDRGKDVKYAKPDFLPGEKGVPTVPTTI